MVFMGRAWGALVPLFFVDARVVQVQDAQRFVPRVPQAQLLASRLRAARMLEPPFELPYEVPKQPKPFSDYEWDDSYPGTFKPGTRGENYDMDEVEKMWKGH